MAATRLHLNCGAGRENRGTIRGRSHAYPVILELLFHVDDLLQGYFMAATRLHLNCRAGRENRGITRGRSHVHPVLLELLFHWDDLLNCKNNLNYLRTWP